ncbi:uncharacterized protein LOC109537467 isoform X1 [Dendroctonus ponderosae]|uniref:3'-5' exonuclease domain-containing protein n=1 Tax=Dendroctonus ponderosae TaxID=77166 RepID=U4UN96_DENPD|nr:uncharacterized protein LOC109537467 isoform X1 [Dendroctonus ponderosae]XP_048521107.1 uncharacterized protein LOC109537467 isoform X1 [Dendroctonus ponderosae]ERL91480.1 hypothetical protein D910_08810 [Dendroctonus ponderosae]KAH1024429.1 hypothetical protein HUJ05_003914 [Dendroctonus ponderosae]
MESKFHKIYELGDRLVVELKTREIFNGIYVDGGKDRIVLDEVIQHNNSNQLRGLYEFYRSEIESVHCLQATLIKENQPEDTPEETSEEPPNEKKMDLKHAMGRGAIKLSEEEYFRLKEMSRSYIYLENADKRYFDAIKVLKDAENIGVMCVGVDPDRRSRISLLALSTRHQVYLLDFSQLQRCKMYPEVKAIFESESICKVIYRGAPLAEILYKSYSVRLQNTFDTQAADLLVQKRNEGDLVERNLSECLAHYLCLPRSLLDQALSITTNQWRERPLNNQLKLYAAQLVVYLVLLKSHLQRLLLSDFYNLMSKLQDHVRVIDDFRFRKYSIAQGQLDEDVMSMIKTL